jgi:SHS2 domain-containing protein
MTINKQRQAPRFGDLKNNSKKRRLKMNSERSITVPINLDTVQSLIETHLRNLRVIADSENVTFMDFMQEPMEDNLLRLKIELSKEVFN